MAATPTSLTEQHMQPLASGTKSMGFASVLLASEIVSCFSISMAEMLELVDGPYGHRNRTYSPRTHLVLQQSSCRVAQSGYN